ncbi:MAG: DUF429 domain-containing protein [Promethearchaeota archaeon]
MVGLKVIGIDGCKGGWLCFVIFDDGSFSISIYDTIKDAVESNEPFRRILIDIPIGLEDGNGTSRRECDREARRVLGRPRASSIFPVPCRQAIYARDYLTANQINKEVLGVGISKQAWNISSKIKKVDEFLHGNPEFNDVIFESHPEICFWAFNRHRPMKHYKKTQKGQDERLNLLLKHGGLEPRPLSRAEITLKNKMHDVDDVLDAWVLAITAATKRGLKTLPDKPGIDSTGLFMRIVYADL